MNDRRLRPVAEFVWFVACVVRGVVRVVRVVCAVRGAWCVRARRCTYKRAYNEYEYTCICTNL